MDEREFELCVEAMCNGDKQGLRRVYETYAKYIYSIVYGILGSRENAEDVTSEFFIKLWEKSEQYKLGNGHKGYLATMARNMAIDYLRKYKKEELTAVVHDMGSDAHSDEECGMEAGRMRKVQEAAGQQSVSVEQEVIGEMNLQELLQILKPGERKVVDMKVLGELTFREIADILGLPMGTVTWQYQNAMKKLRRCGYEEL